MISLVRNGLPHVAVFDDEHVSDVDSCSAVLQFSLEHCTS